MKIISITSGYATRSFYIRDDAIADESYTAIKKAMQEFKEYGNDREKTVSFDHGGGETTVRLSTLTDVTIWALNDDEAETIREIRAWKTRFSEDASEPTKTA